MTHFTDLGNQNRLEGDLLGMDCSAARTILSAALDGEARPDELGAADGHVDGCGTCQRWQVGAQRLHRTVTVRPAEPVPDLTAPIMAAFDERPDWRQTWMRVALAWVAALLIVGSVPALMADTSNTTPHLSRHLGAFTIALGVGLAGAAWRPGRAAALLPMVGALAGASVAAAALDVTGGREPLTGEGLHLLEIAGLSLLWLLAGGPAKLRSGWERNRPHRHHGPHLRHAGH
ncbi:MAG: hypothetical protein GY929_13235 [Actinomycetia bacterium]|nr:hypothetical protein [Actinomycetes bacterium]